MATKGTWKRFRALALSYPGASEHKPWGETVAKVGGKVFVFLGVEGAAFAMSVKLGPSADAALAFPFAEPTGYGLGRAGWISVHFEPGQEVPEGLLVRWLDASYRAIAPKKLLRELEEKPPAPAKKRKPAAKKGRS